MIHMIHCLCMSLSWPFARETHQLEKHDGMMCNCLRFSCPFEGRIVEVNRAQPKVTFSLSHDHLLLNETWCITQILMALATNFES